MRFAFFIIRLLLIFGVLRYVIGFLMKFVGSAMGSSPWPATRSAQFAKPRAPERSQAFSGVSPGAPGVGRELRKDPVCGTFIPIDSSLQQKVNGEIVYFCSAGCRDRFKAA